MITLKEFCKLSDTQTATINLYTRKNGVRKGLCRCSIDILLAGGFEDECSGKCEYANRAVKAFRQNYSYAMEVEIDGNGD